MMSARSRAERQFGALAYSLAASPDTLTGLIAYNPQERSEGTNRLQEHVEKRRITRVLVFWAIWAPAVILGYALLF